MALKFRKKPVEIEAMGWSGSIESAQRIIDWAGGAVVHDTDRDVLVINTLEGEMVGNQFDWIIKGVQGEFYPCKPDIFELTYEEVKA